MSAKFMNRTKLLVGAFAVLVFVVRWLSPERPMDYTGPRSLLDAGFALALLVILLLLAAGLGWKLLHRLQFNDLTISEQILLGIPLGFGVIAYGIYAIGLIGFLQPLTIVLLLILIGVWTQDEWSESASKVSLWLITATRNWLTAGIGRKLITGIIALIFILTLCQALSPPTDPDGLIDHLQAPKLFLEAAKFYPMPEFVFANYPFTIESLFTIGMIFGSDTFAKVLHLVLASFLVLVLYMLGRKHLRAGTEWIPVVILLGMPIFPIWASLAYVDMGWSLFELLAIYTLMRWSEKSHRRWLILAGLMTGLALGSKYLAFEGAAALGLWILWHSRKEGWKNVLRSASLFGAAALLVCSPWYLKNLLWFGDPIYPYLSNNAASLVGNYESFGLMDYLLIPVNLYINRELFIGVYGSVEFPSIFFLLVFLYPWSRRSKVLDGLAGMTFLRFGFWAIISHWRFRYLLPALPGLSLLASNVMTGLTERPLLRRWGPIIVNGLAGGMLVGTLMYSVIYFVDVQPYRVVLGTESKTDFLRREVSDYAAKEYIQTNLSSDELAFMPWDARGYYCDNRCLPDWQRNKWLALTISNSSPTAVADKLNEMNVSHLLLSIEDVDYSIINDETGQNKQSLEFFLNDFIPACAKEIYRDEWTMLYELTCD